MNHWDAAYLTAAPFFLGSAMYKRWRHGKYRRSLAGMFGANLPDPPLPSHRERVWLHSVSVGETVAAASVFRQLRERHPGWEFLSTTTTETGQDQARRSLAEADHHDFAPADISWNVRKFLRVYNPSLYLFFETEIWPNMLLESGRRGLPVFLVNGKLSERSGRRYHQLRDLFRPPLSQVTAFLMQTDDDAARMARIIGREDNVHVTGNVKFDSLPEPLTDEERKRFRKSWGVSREDFVILAGSTHPAEEKLVFEAYRGLCEAHPKVRLVLAPRHPERFNRVAEDLADWGAAVRRTSQPEAPADESPDEISVTLLDEMGVLSQAFGAADVAIVGGAWNPIGGHNLLEPSSHGIPVIHGPHMHAQKEIMRIVERHGATISVPGRELGGVIDRLIRDPREREELGKRGREAAQANRGAALRSVEILEKYL